MTLLELVFLYYVLSTLVAWYFIIGIPTAHITDGVNIIASLCVSLVVGWLLWWLFIGAYIWVRRNPDETLDYLKRHNDPRYKDYE